MSTSASHASGPDILPAPTRKGLSAVHEDAIDSVIPVNKQAAIGQDDLFGGLRGTDDDQPSSGLDFTIDDTEWPRRQLRAAERDMLGMYVSAHPLDGTEHILTRHRSTTITELTAAGRTEGVVTLAGHITHVQRKTTKQGKAWAVVHLADRDGEMEILYFPDTYTLVRQALMPDSVVAVQGRLNERDGNVSLVGQELAVLDISSAERIGKPPYGDATHRGPTGVPPNDQARGRGDSRGRNSRPGLVAQSVTAVPRFPEAEPVHRGPRIQVAPRTSSCGLTSRSPGTRAPSAVRASTVTASSGESTTPSTTGHRGQPDPP
jgi:hypothetical protein